MCPRTVGWRSSLGASLGLMLLLGGAEALRAEATAPAQIEELPLITQVLQLHQAAAQARRLVCAIRLEAVVCAADSGTRRVILQDDTGAEMVQLARWDPALVPGQRVRLEGKPCQASLTGFGVELGAGPVVDNDGIHALATKAGKVYLPAGHHPLRLLWFNAAGKLGLQVLYQGPGLIRQRIPNSALFRPQVEGVADSTNFVPGLQYRCFEVDGRGRLPDLDQLPVNKSGTTANFDLSVRSRDERVALEFTGCLAVAQEGWYTFETQSDDGSQLFVGVSRLGLAALGTAEPPPARHRTLGETLSAQQDRQWAQVEGTVNFVSEHSDCLELELGAGPERMRVSVWESAGLPLRLLLHSRVRATGICQRVYSSEGREMAGELALLSARQLDLLEVAPELWSAYPLQTLSQAPSQAGQVVHLRGHVGALSPALSLVDVTGQVSLQTAQVPPEAGGGAIEVLGCRAGSRTNEPLRWAVYRQVTDDSDHLPQLHSGQEIKGLKRQEAQRGFPAKIRGVITRPNTLALQDGTRGVFISVPAGLTTENPGWGEYWEVEGITGPGDFAPVLQARRLTRLGVGALPEPAEATWDQLLNGSLDTQYVELQGIVTAVQGKGLELMLREGKIKLNFPDLPPGRLERYLNTLVRVRGCLFPAWDRTTHQLKVGEIDICSAAINVDEPAPADVFATPLKRAAELLLFDLRAGAFQRVKVAGQVLGARAGQYFLTDGTNGLRLNAQGATDLQAGDLVEAVGFPELVGPSPLLREAVVRRTGRQPLPPPTLLNREHLLAEACDATRVRVSGVLVNRRQEQAEQVLEFQVGARTALARLAGASPSVRALVPGSILELTGVYAGLGGNRALGRGLNSFELLLNAPADIRVLARPSWWTLPRLLTAFGFTGLFLAGAMLWVVSLRRQVRAQTELIRQKALREATLEERTRIAKDIHDDLGSSLTFIMMLGERSREDLHRPVELAVHTDKIVGYARGAVQALDEIVWAVNPQNDTLDGLVGYLNQYANQFFDNTNIRCRLDLPDPLPALGLPAELRHDLFLVIKEALNNVLKYAQATEVSLVVREAAGDLEITITDNGRGFAPDQVGPHANGLENMRKRLTRFGGQFALTTAPGQGTRLQLRVRLGAGASYVRTN